MLIFDTKINIFTPLVFFFFFFPDTLIFDLKNISENKN